MGVIRCYVGEPSRFAQFQGGKARRFAYPREQTDRRVGVIRRYVGEPSRFAPLQGGKARRFAYHADAPSDTFCQTGMRAADDLNAHFDNPIEELS